jgi:hypothetical protein
LLQNLVLKTAIQGCSSPSAMTLELVVITASVGLEKSQSQKKFIFFVPMVFFPIFIAISTGQLLNPVILTSLEPLSTAMTF